MLPVQGSLCCTGTTVGIRCMEGEMGGVWNERVNREVGGGLEESKGGGGRVEREVG